MSSMPTTNIDGEAADSRSTRAARRITALPVTLMDKVRANLHFRSSWAELNGAMGDLGTYIPIVLALALAKDLDLGTTLVFTGAYNIITGAIYGVPMPVQPMKSIAAVAISTPTFTVPEIMAAGICTSATVFLLGVTRLMGVAYRLIPLPVVRGIQLGQGLSFALTAVKYVRNQQDLAKGKSLGPRPWLGLDGLVVGIAAAVFIIVVTGAGQEEEHEDGRGSVGNPKRWRRVFVAVPSAVLVFVLGVVFAIIRQPNVLKGLLFGPSRIRIVEISKQAWKEGFLKGAVPQLPLSVLNSVIAVCKLTADLFPEKAPPSASSVAVTMGAMNLAGCWFGAMPCCHGAGGLAGQYRFGGRSGGCVAALGAAKAAVGLLLGASLLRLLAEFPVTLLGVLLLFAGLELAMAARDMAAKDESFVVLLCTAVALVGSSAALGFVCGMVAQALIVLRRRSMECPSEG